MNPDPQLQMKVAISVAELACQILFENIRLILDEGQIFNGFGSALLNRGTPFRLLSRSAPKTQSSQGNTLINNTCALGLFCKLKTQTAHCSTENSRPYPG